LAGRRPPALLVTGVSSIVISTRLRCDLVDILGGALDAVRADRLVRVALEDPPPPLTTAASVRIAAVGKASSSMASAFAEWAGSRLGGGVVVAPHGDPFAGPVSSAIETVHASHPSPDAHSEEAARLVLEQAASARADGTPFVLLLSGGASSLMALPTEGLSLAEKAATADALMRAGASIDQLNTVRKHLSAIKGGRLAVRAGTSVTLAVSDVVTPVADDPGVIGSGPTVADVTTFREALAILARFRLDDGVPAAALNVLGRGAAGEIEETIKPGDRRLVTSQYRLIGSRVNALAGARRAAEVRGYAVAEIAEPVTGDARSAAERLMGVAASLAADAPGPLCLLAAGETTVRVRGAGMGGRNQELTLDAVLAARGLREVGRPFAVASVGTDGIDGPTDAAGALADQDTLDRALAAGLDDPRDFLDENDTYRFFEPLGDLIKTGPTGTNVGDVQVVLIA
jgi:glycerate-2-kinase